SIPTATYSRQSSLRRRSSNPSIHVAVSVSSAISALVSSLLRSKDGGIPTSAQICIAYSAPSSICFVPLPPPPNSGFKICAESGPTPSFWLQPTVPSRPRHLSSIVVALPRRLRPLQRCQRSIMLEQGSILRSKVRHLGEKQTLPFPRLKLPLLFSADPPLYRSRSSTRKALLLCTKVLPRRLPSPHLAPASSTVMAIDGPFSTEQSIS
ncbi:hypothetical protein GW17_00053528, partial [Ensete ventricosum]